MKPEEQPACLRQVTPNANGYTRIIVCDGIISNEQVEDTLRRYNREITEGTHAYSLYVGAIETYNQLWVWFLCDLKADFLVWSLDKIWNISIGGFARGLRQIGNDAARIWRQRAKILSLQKAAKAHLDVIKNQGNLWSTGSQQP
jgi:hypothetical protein